MIGNQLELSELKRCWIDEAALRFKVHAPRLGQFTNEDLHRLFPAPEHPNWWGVLFAQLRNKGLIRRVSARSSNRPEANGRLISVWEVT